LIDYSTVKTWLQKTVQASYDTVTGGLCIAGAGAGYVVEWVGKLRIFGATSTGSANQAFDQRHYFLVPDPMSADGYSLFVTRCLPEGVPPINDLPKQRIVHLPNKSAEAMLRTLLVRQAQMEELSKPLSSKTWGDHASEMADAIDNLDQKAFGGVLLIGGLVAIFNPIAGAAIAAKALVPSLGMWASTYGLRAVGEKLNQADLERRAKQAETDVLNQFRGSSTIQQVNRVLAILEIAIRTTEDEYDPMVELHNVLTSEMTESERQAISLASAAVLSVYETTVQSTRSAKQAGLGPEDIRFIELLKSLKADS
jgi:hypothetical protein